jgi:hypothetical protein
MLCNCWVETIHRVVLAQVALLQHGVHNRSCAVPNLVPTAANAVKCCLLSCPFVQIGVFNHVSYLGKTYYWAQRNIHLAGCGCHLCVGTQMSMTTDLHT